MAVREFSDSGGREWRVWNVVPEAIHPQTKTEDYLALMYQTGWLVFETKTEDEKRRLADVPVGWSQLDDRELELLLQRAEVIPPRKLRSLQQARGAEAARDQERATRRAEQLADMAAAHPAVPEEEQPDVTDLGIVRTFRYPGGRFWTVCLIKQPEEGRPPVLRFTAGARYVDMADWPKAWADYPDEQLVELLRQAAPRRPDAPPPKAGTPRRRWDDPRP